MARRASLSRTDHRRKEKVLTQAQSARIDRTTEAIVCKYGALFFLSDDAGDVKLDREQGFGLYLHDCRYLDGYELRVDGERLVSLTSFNGHGYEATYYLGVAELPAERGRAAVPKDTIAIRRDRVIRDEVVYEVIAITHHGTEKTRFRLDVLFRSRFLDLFVIRGFVHDHGKENAPRRGARDTISLRYLGLDDVERTTTLAFAPAPRTLTRDRAAFDVALGPGETRRIAVTITPREHARRRGAARATEPSFQPGDIGDLAARDERDWVQGFASVASEDRLFEEVIRRALLDLRLLRGERYGLHFVAAGVPWFGTLFGRDSCVVGLQTLPFGPSLAAETLRLLARFQAKGTDPYRDAEPGKILHELRTGELAAAKLIPQSPAYYGTVDATLLWLILLGQYVNWTGDLAIAHELRESLEAAVGWSIGPADHDGDGYIDYGGRYAHGLVNQGWKDSGSSIVNEDGSLADPPIALVEVQAYAYRAWRSAARVFRLLGDEPRCKDLSDRASDLQRRFERDFWSSRLGCYVIARQRDGRPCEVISSNAGQVLWGGIASRAHAKAVAARMLGEDMFTGWGIRTLSAAAAAYNPISYHLGSVWPHDNSLIIGGLRRYGHDDAAEKVFSALFDAAASFRDQRVPELFCGYPRNAGERSPVSYPVACIPQAWAAGALPYALWQMLGLRARAAERKLLVSRPRLPRWLPSLEIRGLTIRDMQCDLRFERTGDNACDVRVVSSDSALSIERTD